MEFQDRISQFELEWMKTKIRKMTGEIKLLPDKVRDQWWNAETMTEKDYIVEEFYRLEYRRDREERQRYEWSRTSF
jgi:hypothetical protein